jgi:RNase P subunit RPR2
MSFKPPNSSNPRQGYRFFTCFKCEENNGQNFDFKVASRDSFSPSKETCPKCNFDADYQYGEVDESVKIDKNRNLIT